MECKYNIMPNAIQNNLFHGKTDEYLEALYLVFKRDFVDGEVYYEEKKVSIIHEKYYRGKERSFWHIISEGEEDATRIPISTRAEKIAWVKALIEDKKKCEKYRNWIKYHEKTKRNRIFIWCKEFSYMIILEDRKTHYKLITAFNVLEQQIKKYDKEYNKYSKNENAH